MTRRRLLPIAFLVLLAAGLRLGRPAGALPAAAPPPVAGTFPDEWVHGAACGVEPKVQVHAYEEDLYILRQSPCPNFEAPFLYLIFGRDEAILIDTGSAAGVELYPVVRDVIQGWLSTRGEGPIELIVVHSHNHGDHVANDAEFVGIDGVTLIPPGLSQTEQFWGFTAWPDEVVSRDLGGRIVDVIPTPGHAGDCIAVYDRRTQLLLTNDTVYPGRLYVFGAQAAGQWDVFKASIRRLVDFTAEHPVSWLVGCHIEMTDQPGVDFPYGTDYHPDEHVLQLEPEVLLELDAALAPLTEPQLLVLDDVIVQPVF